MQLQKNYEPGCRIRMMLFLRRTLVRLVILLSFIEA